MQSALDKSADYVQTEMQATKFARKWRIRIYTDILNKAALGKAMLQQYKMKVESYAPQQKYKAERIMTVMFMSGKADGAPCSTAWAEIPEVTRASMKPGFEWKSAAYGQQLVNGIKLQGVGDKPVLELQVLGAVREEDKEIKFSPPRGFLLVNRKYKARDPEPARLILQRLATEDKKLAEMKFDIKHNKIEGEGEVAYTMAEVVSGKEVGGVRQVQYYRPGQFGESPSGWKMFTDTGMAKEWWEEYKNAIIYLAQTYSEELGMEDNLTLTSADESETQQEPHLEKAYLQMHSVNSSDWVRKMRESERKVEVQVTVPGKTDGEQLAGAALWARPGDEEEVKKDFVWARDTTSTSMDLQKEMTAVRVQFQSREDRKQFLQDLTDGKILINGMILGRSFATHEIPEPPPGKEVAPVTDFEKFFQDEKGDWHAESSERSKAIQRAIDRNKEASSLLTQTMAAADVKAEECKRAQEAVNTVLVKREVEATFEVTNSKDMKRNLTMALCAGDRRQRGKRRGDRRIQSKQSDPSESAGDRRRKAGGWRPRFSDDRGGDEYANDFHGPRDRNGGPRSTQRTRGGAGTLHMPGGRREGAGVRRQVEKDEAASTGRRSNGSGESGQYSTDGDGNVLQRKTNASDDGGHYGRAQTARGEPGRERPQNEIAKKAPTGRIRPKRRVDAKYGHGIRVAEHKQIRKHRNSRANERIDLNHPNRHMHARRLPLSC